MIQIIYIYLHKLQRLIVDFAKMGNSVGSSSSKQSKKLPIDKIFKFPSSLPTFPSGEGFGSGTIDLGGLIVCQVTTFTKIWTTYEGGQDDLGATFFEPSNIPEDFFMLGCYAQPNNRPLFGWILAAKDNSGESSSLPALEKPTDYELEWSSEKSKINQDGYGYIWQPIPPTGYKAVGHVITNSPEKPSLEKIRCVRDDLTDELELDKLIWEEESVVNVYGLKPKNRGIQAQGVGANTFISTTTSIESNSTPTLSLACLKNNNFNNLLSSYMPNMSQIEALYQAYSPIIHFHPKETYLPSSVNWYFSNGALLYQKDQESNPIAIEPNGANLPQDGSNDGLYWLDLPVDEKAKLLTMKGDLQSSEVYVQVKPMAGGIFTDIVTWIFYPYNGPSTAKLGFVDLPLGKIGEHVGDWEHITLRISNFTGVLHNVYLSQHARGTWYDASVLEYSTNSNKLVAYSSLHGHAIYPKPGLVLQGSAGVGIRNDTGKSKLVLDTGKKFSIVSGSVTNSVIEEPSWLKYARKWGPSITYSTGVELEKVKGSSKQNLKGKIESLAKILPNEVYGEEGPTGPKMKINWSGDERIF